MAMHVGIDFGTSFSSAAFMDNEISMVVKDPSSRNSSVPSSVFVTAQGQVLVGSVAENRRLSDPGRYRRDLKRVLGRSTPLPFGNQTFPVETLIGKILDKMKQDVDTLAVNMKYQPFTKAVLTIPATYQNHKRQLMLQAAKDARFTQRGVKLLEEPTAAAFYYARQSKMREGEIILVYDLGGGTFDTALLQKRDEGFEYLAVPAGIESLGGIDFDRAIYNDLVKRHPHLQTILRGDREDQSALIARIMVGELCIRMKHQLSEVNEAEETIFVPGENSLLTHHLSRIDFNQMIVPSIQETIKCCTHMIQAAGINYERIDQIVLVGGSCRIPYVRQALQQELKRPINAVADLELVVCQGAALYNPVEQYAVSPAAGEDGYTTINAALRAAEPKSRIFVQPGNYPEHIILDKEVEIIGSGPREKIIIESFSEPCITMRTDRAQVRDITLQQQKDVNTSVSEDSDESESICAVSIPCGNLSLENCDISSKSGSGIIVTEGGTYAELHRCTIQDNAHQGILIQNGASALIEECTISSNEYSGMYITSEESGLAVRACQVHDNQSGGICLSDGVQGSFEDCDIARNYMAGIIMPDSRCNPVIKTCTIHENTGHGMYISAGAKGIVTDCDIHGNSDSGVRLTDKDSNTTFIRCQIHNDAQNGVEIDDEARGRFENCTIFENGGAGVSIANEGTDPTFIQCNIHHNRGVGIKVREAADAHIERCDISNNKKAGISLADEDSNLQGIQCQIHDNYGAGIKVKKSAQGHFEGCDIYDNQENGISIENEDSYPLIRTCLIHDNEENGLYISDEAQGTIEDCDIYDNEEDGIVVVDEYTKPTFTQCQSYGNDDLDLNVSDDAIPTIRDCFIKDNTGGDAYPSLPRKIRRLR